MTVEEMPSSATAAIPEDFIPISADGQLKKRIIREGSGQSPTAGSTVRVHYVGTLFPSGEKFDSSRDRDDMFEFKLGQGQVIRGWDEGVATMKIGELSELLCPSEYAYGETGSPPRIPGGATLKFEVELFDFDEAADTTPKKLELAMNAKTSGNDFFKASDFIKASVAYQKGLKYLDDIYDMTEAQQAEQLRPLQQTLYLNLAACQLKLKNAGEAALSCEKVLDMDSDNVKALFRLGQAYCMQGEYDKALVELKRAKEFAPSDLAIQKEIIAVTKSQEAYRQKERSMFSKMFS